MTGTARFAPNPCHKFDAYVVHTARVRVTIDGGGDVDDQTLKAGKAIYTLAVDAFLEGVTPEILPAELFGISEADALVIRGRQYIRHQRQLRKTA